MRNAAAGIAVVISYGKRKYVRGNYDCEHFLPTVSRRVINSVDIGVYFL